MRSNSFWLRAACGLLALALLAACVFTLWYRKAYNVWPGQGASARVHWCGRDYETGPGPPLTWRQITADQHLPIRPVGEYPPLGLSRRELLAPILPARQAHVSPSGVCAVVIYLRAGPDRYKPYGLLGGP
jgi:hypothetical protein